MSKHLYILLPQTPVLRQDDVPKHISIHDRVEKFQLIILLKETHL